VQVFIPSPLLSYTKSRTVRAAGETLAEVVLDLERQFPGLRFRIIDEQDKLRPHMRYFVNSEQVFTLEHTVLPGDEVHLVQALSGG
jgi:sulfur-carrier protein